MHNDLETDSLTLCFDRNWLTPREEQVDCKGKGLMTTYWCNVRSGSRTESVRSSNESRTEGKQADSKGAKDNHLEGEMEDRGIVQTTKLAPAQRSKDTNDENRTEI